MEEGFERLSALFTAARRLGTEAERAVFLDEACAGDAALRAKVDALLEEHGKMEAADLGIGDVAAAVWDAAVGPPADPDRLGVYRVLRRIGEGGMGTVYEAEQALPRRRVALKVLRSGNATREAIQRLEREGQMLARLQHRGIAQIFEVGRTETPLGPRPFLAMELVDGVRLDEFVARDGVDLRARLELMADVCDAVSHAHLNGVIHRDLKPGNILVDREGRPKVLDFGVARPTDPGTGGLTLRTKTGHVVGTLAYMSPEQARGDPNAVDTRTDVYALGVICYQLVAGRLPHEVDAVPLPTAMRRVFEEEPPTLGNLDRSFRGDLSIIVSTAMEKDPARRYQGAHALAADLRSYLADRPITARAPSATYQVRKFVRRHKALVGAAVGILVTLVAGLFVALSFARRAGARASEAQWAVSRLLLGAAHDDLREFDVVTARRRLDRIPPEHRGFAWRYVAGQLDRSLTRVPIPTRGMVAACWSPDLERVLYADGARAVFELRAADGKPARPPMTQSGEGVLSACFLAGRALLCSVGPGGSVRLGDLPVVETYPGLPERLITGPLVASADGRWIAVASESAGYAPSHVSIVDASDGSVRKHFAIDKSQTEVLAFAPDGRELAAAGTDMIVRLFDLATLEERLALRGHRNIVQALAFSPDGTRIASGARDKEILVWDRATGEARLRLHGHTGAVRTVCFGPNGRWIASAGEDRTVRTWDLGTGEAGQVLTGHTGTVHAIAWDGAGLRTVGEDGIRTWAVGPEDQLRVLRLHAGRSDGNPYPYIYAAAFSPDGAWLASAGWDGTVRICSTATLELRWTLRFPGLPHIHDVDYDAAGRRLAVCGDRIAVHDLRTGETRTRELAFGDQVRSVAFSRDGKRLLAGGRRNLLYVLDAQTLEMQASWPGHDDEISDIAVSPDGRRIATASWDGSCLIRDAGGRVLTRIEGHEDKVEAVAFSRDSARVATGSWDRTVRIWDARTGEELHRLEGHKDKVYCVSFHRDGSLASGSNDNTIRLWDGGTGDQLLELRGHDDYVHEVVFSPDGKTLASAGGDNTVRLWSTVPFAERWRAAGR